MNERVWTRDELDDVWPLDKHGFSWVWTHSGVGWVGWVASSDDLVCYWRDGELIDDGVPVEVMLAVCSVALGLDSREAIAMSFDERAEEMNAKSQVGGGYSDILHAREATGRAVEAQRCAAVVRRGRVSP